MPSISKVNSKSQQNNFNSLNANLNKTDVIALVGNPNVGKSVIFNALTGLKMDVSNYPGTTIEIATASLTCAQKNYTLIDTPGIYGVSSLNDEEIVARSGILHADLIINVVSALSLDRDLFLTQQLIDFGKPMILVINQWDEAIANGLTIDVAQLEAILQIPVLTCVAVSNLGIENIKTNLNRACFPVLKGFLADKIQPIIKNGLSQAQAILLLEDDNLTKLETLQNYHSLRDEIYSMRRGKVNDIYNACVIYKSQKLNFSKKLGSFLIHPFWGSCIAFLVCYLLFYQLLGVIIAQKLVDITEKQGMKIYYEPKIKEVFAFISPVTIKVNDTDFYFPQGFIGNKQEYQQFTKMACQYPVNEINYNFWHYHNIQSGLSNILVGEYGILTLTVTYLFALLFPLVLGFYLGLSLLEDSGYLPRLAVLVDRLLNKIGLNGRAIIPLILGLGCVTMATITTRLLTTRREKIIATALLGIAIPCSAQLGVVSGVLASCGGSVAWLVYLTIVFSMLAIAGLVLNTILPGDSAGLIIDLPPMRMPRIRNVLSKTWGKSFSFLQESIPMFALASLVVTIAQMLGLLDVFVQMVKPITVNWLNLPNDPRVATTFILGIVRRDFASFGLTQVVMTPVQAVVAMIVITLFVPCIATVGVMIKERGAKIALSIWFMSWVLAFGIGGLLAKLLPIFMH